MAADTLEYVQHLLFYFKFSFFHPKLSYLFRSILQKSLQSPLVLQSPYPEWVTIRAVVTSSSTTDWRTRSRSLSCYDLTWICPLIHRNSIPFKRNILVYPYVLHHFLSISWAPFFFFFCITIKSFTWKLRFSLKSLLLLLLILSWSHSYLLWILSAFVTKMTSLLLIEW